MKNETPNETRLLYLSPVHWQSYAQRPHYFARYFLEETGGKVLWVDPYLSRLPRPGDVRYRPAMMDQKTEKPPGLSVLHVPALPVEPLPGGTFLNRALLWRRPWKAIADFAGKGRLVIGVGKPSRLAVEVLKGFDAIGTFYDAMDLFPAFHAGLSRKAMVRAEEEVVRRVDELYVSSSHIEEIFSSSHDRVTKILNACDPRLPPEACRRPKEVSFGYVGSIADWFDWEAVRKLARAFPEVPVHLVGPVFHPPGFKKPTNILLHGPRSPDEAGEYMKKFSIGLIPFKETPLTRGVDPIKYYEYRAHGLPVLTTPFGEMNRRRGEEGLFFFNQGEDLVRTVTEALETPVDMQSILDFRKRNTWEYRLREGGVFS